MFTKILIANRGDNWRAAPVAMKSHRMAREACAGELAAGG
jgi:hypothetical protein